MTFLLKWSLYVTKFVQYFSLWKQDDVSSCVWQKSLSGREGRRVAEDTLWCARAACKLTQARWGNIATLRGLRATALRNDPFTLPRWRGKT